jgi:hypothetical protein
MVFVSCAIGVDRRRPKASRANAPPDDDVARQREPTTGVHASAQQQLRSVDLSP